MFEKDIERIRALKLQTEFISYMFDGYTFLETCAVLKLNPAACGMFMNECPDFEEGVRKAQAFRVDVMVDKLEKIDEHVDNPVMAGVISKNIQWLAAKRMRKLYGEKLDVSHNVTINISAAIEEAKQRTLDYGNANALIVNDDDTDNISVHSIVDATLAEDDIDPLS